DSIRGRMRWAIPILGLWLMWSGFFSSHSFYRLWQLKRERVRVEAELARLRQESGRMETESRDPAALRQRAERELRANGMARSGEIVYRIQGSDRDTLPPD